MALKAALPWIAGAVGAVGAIQSSMQQSATAKYNAQVADMNATSQRQWAEFEAGKVRDAGKVQRARMRAAQGASGVEAGTGGFLDVLTSDAIDNELDALSMRLQGQARGQFYDAQAGGFRMQASQARAAAPFSALTAGVRGFTAGGGSFGSSVPPTSNATIRWSGPRVGAV